MDAALAAYTIVPTATGAVRTVARGDGASLAGGRGGPKTCAHCGLTTTRQPPPTTHTPKLHTPNFAPTQHNRAYALHYGNHRATRPIPGHTCSATRCAVAQIITARWRLRFVAA